MKLTTKAIALLVSLTLLLAGCASSNELTTSVVQQLLTNDYEVEYIFAMAGLPVDSRRSVKDEAGTIYFPVDSDKYKTTAELGKLLDATYIPATAAAILATTDADGALLYTDIDGKLCRSVSPLIVGGATTLAIKSAKLASPDKDADGNNSVAVTVPELSGDTEVGKVTLQAVELKKVGWRLAASRAMVAGAQQVQQPEEDSSDGFADTAQQFLDAMVAGDSAKLKELATFADVMGMWDWSQVSFDFLATAGVTEATIVESVRVDERDAEYVASITADGSSKVFPKGTSRYRIVIGVRQDPDTLEDAGYVVVSFWNEADPPYTSGGTDTVPALEQVGRLLNLFGMVQFESPAKLGNDTMTEYLLYELTVAKPEQSEQGYSLEDIQAMALRLLGISSFTPAKQFYSDETATYLLWGRGGMFTNCQLRIIEEAGGLVKVEAMIFADPLRLNHTSSILYTMKNNWNGTYELVSGVLVQE